MDVQPWVIAAGAVVALLVLKRLAAPRAPAELVRQRIDAGARIVDVRTPREFQGGAYPGAVNIPLQVLGARLRELPKNRPVVVYCASGMRSASAARLLRRAGYDDVVNAGGLRHMPS
jgi:phage shock protein E